jgi:protein-disulfide isomerase
LVRSLRLLAILTAVGLASALAAYFLVSQERSARQEGAVAQYAEEIFRSPRSYVAGNPEGDVSVVAFFDYNCPYCRKDAPALSALISADPNVRLVLKELPVLGPESENATRVALAARKQGKYFELWQRLIGARGRVTEASALAIAGELGLDIDRLQRDMDDPAITAAILANMRLGVSLGVRGVPFYLVGDRVLSAKENFPQALTQAVADVRKDGCRAQC